MKQGSADDPFAEDSTDETKENDRREEDESSDGPVSSEESQPLAESPGHTATQTHSLPFIHARDGVKDKRKQRPVFLREHIEDGIDDLVDQMEDEFGETVYKTDVTEAAMVVAQKNPELLLEVLEEWGYGWS
jgi:hypothetical protein